MAVGRYLTKRVVISTFCSSQSQISLTAFPDSEAVRWGGKAPERRDTRLREAVMVWDRVNSKFKMRIGVLEKGRRALLSNWTWGIRPPSAVKIVSSSTSAAISCCVLFGPFRNLCAARSSFRKNPKLIHGATMTLL